MSEKTGVLPVPFFLCTALGKPPDKPCPALHLLFLSGCQQAFFYTGGSAQRRNRSHHGKQNEYPSQCPVAPITLMHQIHGVEKPEQKSGKQKSRNGQYRETSPACPPSPFFLFAMPVGKGFRTLLLFPADRSPKTDPAISSGIHLFSGCEWNRFPECCRIGPSKMHRPADNKPSPIWHEYIFMRSKNIPKKRFKGRFKNTAFITGKTCSVLIKFCQNSPFLTCVNTNSSMSAGLHSLPVRTRSALETPVSGFFALFGAAFPPQAGSQLLAAARKAARRASTRAMIFSRFAS